MTTQDRERHWLPALWLGLISSTYSTLLITLGAGRIGRDPAVDWMQVAMAYFGRDILSASPTWGAILAGVFVHQSADLFWALVFFGFMWSWTRQLSPWHIFIVGIPWAVLTSAIEYYLTLPWLQPWLVMQVPYWTALSVHLASAAVYPLFPLLRQGRGDPHSQRLRLSRWWGVGLMLALMGMGGLWALGESGHEVRWPFAAVQTDSPDGRFLIHMTAHHGVGLQLAQLAAVRSRASEVQDLGLLMAAEHKAEMARMHTWWQSWFQGDMPGIHTQEYQQMVGIPPPDLLQRLQEMDEAPFDRLFLPIMLRHHEGAVVMCNRILQHGFAPRTSLLALSIRHAQLQQMEEMRRLLRERSDDGSAAVPYTW